MVKAFERRLSVKKRKRTRQSAGVKKKRKTTQKTTPRTGKDVYEVEAVLDERQASDGTSEYKLKWQGSKHNRILFTVMFVSLNDLVKNTNCVVLLL